MKFRKKPVVIEAMQWTGENYQEILKFVGFQNSTSANGDVFINTLEGQMLATPGDWIIKGVKGEFYPCKPDIFELSYEAVKEGDTLYSQGPTIISDKACEAIETLTNMGFQYVPMQGWIAPEVLAEDTRQIKRNRNCFESLENACEAMFIKFDETNPRESLNKLIIAETQIALDPKVSSDAQALIDKGKKEADEARRLTNDRSCYEAMEDAASVLNLAIEGLTPALTLNAIISASNNHALDPKVSYRAQELILRGRDIEENKNNLYEAVKGHCEKNKTIFYPNSPFTTMLELEKAILRQPAPVENINAKQNAQIRYAVELACTGNSVTFDAENPCLTVLNLIKKESAQ